MKVTLRDSTVRGDFKSKATQTIEEAYGLTQNTPSEIEKIAKQKERVSDMIKSVSYVYKV